MDKQQLASTVNKVLDEMRQRPIPIGISSRHIHLAAADYARLFPAQPIQPKKALLQPGQYAAEQTVTLVGPKGRLNNVRLLGPLRQTSQVEISRTDARILGIAAPLRMSGNLQGTPGIRLISPFAELELSGGTIVAQRHIHMSPLDALILRVSHGDSVAVASRWRSKAATGGLSSTTWRSALPRICVLRCTSILTRPMRQALTLRKPGQRW